MSYINIIHTGMVHPCHIYLSEGKELYTLLNNFIIKQWLLYVTQNEKQIKWAMTNIGCILVFVCLLQCFKVVKGTLHQYY